MSDSDSDNSAPASGSNTKAPPTKSTPGPAPVLEDADANTLRILLTTDNHLGYNERDPVRGMDSFAAFEEVLYLAKHVYHVDMVLIAGDLFHDNRPSRRTLHLTMELLRRYALGPNPVRLQLLSRNNFRNEHINYQDANYSIDLPIFAIHGNHDDPSRDAGGSDLLAALDLLSMSNLVNYWGRQDCIDQVEVAPVLLQKGYTHLALYGLGSMRDERLNRMWTGKKVKFLRPEEDDENDEEEDGFFNVFCLHQNRDLGRGAKNCVQESMIPEWMDLVVWGHEHECLIDFFESVVGTFRITQPGSSVATSLVAGEAVRKKIGVLDINGKQFRMHTVPLTQVRSFVTTDISLREHRSNLDPDDPKVSKQVGEILEEEVKLMVLHAREKREELLAEAKAAGNHCGDAENSPLKYNLEKPDEVLVRLRVDHSGFSTLNNQRFGAKFVDLVANPTDVLHFHRRKEQKLPSSVTSNNKHILKNPIAPEELAQVNVEDLVTQTLQNPDHKLKILQEKRLGVAMEDFVEKSAVTSIPDATIHMLEDKQKRLIVRAGKGDRTGAEVREFVEDESELQEADEARSSSTKQTKPGKRNRSESSIVADTLDDDDDDLLDDADEAIPPPKKRGAAKSSAMSTGITRGKGRAAPSDPARKAQRRKQRLNLNSDDDDADEVEVQAVKPTRARAKRTTGRAKRVNYSLEDEDEDVSDAAAALDSDDDEDEALVIDEPPKKRKTRATPSRSRARAATTSTRKASSKKATAKRKEYYDSDEDDHVEEIGGTDDLDDDWGTAATKTQN